jgi:hypothetical protein
LLCIGSAFAFILEDKMTEDKQQSHEQIIMQYAKIIYESLGNKRLNTPISKEEFCNHIKEKYFNRGYVYINNVFRVLTSPGEDGGDDTEGGGNKHK